MSDETQHEIDERYYTIAEIMALFKVTRKTVYNWMDGETAGVPRLSYVNVGSHRRVSQRQLSAFIRAGGAEGDKEQKRRAPVAMQYA